MNQKFCESCGMPMGESVEMYGTEADGTKSTEYCSFCYEKGVFTMSGDMAEMIEICVPHVVEGNPGVSQEDARKMMLQWFPTLKRWKG